MPWPIQRPAGVPANLETVDQLISLEYGMWDEELIKGVFEAETVNAIASRPVNRFNPLRRDGLVWVLEKTGKFTAHM